MATSQQDVIKKFMDVLNNHGYNDSSTAAKQMLDEAVRAISTYGGIQEAINAFISAMNGITADNLTTKLNEICGIDLNNADTGAITGSDAGGTEKTKDSVVPEDTTKTFNADDFSKDEDGYLCFTVSGLTMRVKSDDFSSTDYRQTIVEGLYKWWVVEPIKLNSESYGIDFETNGVTVTQMDLVFENAGEGTLALVNHQSSKETGEASKLTLKINTEFYNVLTDKTEVNGKVKDNNYLDRTLAHEFTHAIMAANIDWFSKLPQFIKEGMAELTHGIDDIRKDRIEKLATDTNTLKTTLDINDTSTGNSDAYAGGYMFLRWLAKTAAASNDTPLGERTANVNLTSSDNANYYIDSTSADANATTSTPSNNSLEVGKVAAGVYTAENNTVKQNITYDNTISKIEDVGSHFTLKAAEGNNEAISIYGSGYGNSVVAGAGADYINIVGAKNTINAGDGNNTIYGNDSNSGSSYITTGSGNDSVQALGNRVTINSGEGNDKIQTGGSYSTVHSGDGNDYISEYYTGQTSNYYDGGAGADTFWFYSSKTTILGGEGKDNINNGSTSTDNDGKIVTTAGGSEVYIDGGDGDDKIYNKGDYATILGGEGNDYIHNGGKNYNYISTGAGNNTVLNDGGYYVTIEGGDGDDSINGNGNNVYINTGDGNNTVQNNSDEGNITIIGGSGNDYIFSKSSDTTINAGDGNNTITGDGTTHANSSVKTGSGNDSINYYGDNVTIDAGAGADTILAHAGSEYYSNMLIDAGAGADYVSVGVANSTIYGGEGDDTINEDALTSAVAENNYIDAGAGNDFIVVHSTGSTILGGEGKDTINVYKENTTIDGGADKDVIVIHQDATTLTLQDFDVAEDKLKFHTKLESAEWDATNSKLTLTPSANGDKNITIYLTNSDDKTIDPKKIKFYNPEATSDKPKWSTNPNSLSTILSKPDGSIDFDWGSAKSFYSKSSASYDDNKFWYFKVNSKDDDVCIREGEFGFYFDYRKGLSDGDLCVKVYLKGDDEKSTNYTDYYPLVLDFGTWSSTANSGKGEIVSAIDDFSGTIEVITFKDNDAFAITYDKQSKSNFNVAFCDVKYGSTLSGLTEKDYLELAAFDLGNDENDESKKFNEILINTKKIYYDITYDNNNIVIDSENLPCAEDGVFKVDSSEHYLKTADGTTFTYTAGTANDGVIVTVGNNSVTSIINLTGGESITLTDDEKTIEYKSDEQGTTITKTTTEVKDGWTHHTEEQVLNFSSGTDIISGGYITNTRYAENNNSSGEYKVYEGTFTLGGASNETIRVLNGDVTISAGGAGNDYIYIASNVSKVTINNFDKENDTLILQNVSLDGSSKAAWDSESHVLTVHNTAGNAITIQLDSSFSDFSGFSDLKVANADSGGTFNNNDTQKLGMLFMGGNQTMSLTEFKFSLGKMSATSKNSVTFLVGSTAFATLTGLNDYASKSAKSAITAFKFESATGVISMTQSATKILQGTLPPSGTKILRVADSYGLGITLGSDSDKAEVLKITSSGNKGNEKGGLAFFGGKLADTVNLYHASIFGAESKIPAFTISGGEGKDVFTFKGVTIAGGTFSIDGGSSNDKLSFINDYITGGSIGVYGGKGADEITFSSTKITGGKITINGGNGADTFNLKGLTLSGSASFQVLGDAGSDTFTLNNVSAASAAKISLFGGGDNDTFSITNSRNIWISDTTGSNTFTLATSSDVKVFGGAGKDAYTISGGKGNWISDAGGANSFYVKDAKNVTVYGGSGKDTFDVSGASENLTLYGGGGGDLFNISSGTGLFVGGADADTFNLSGFTVGTGKSFSVAGGKGADVFSLTNVAGVTLTGGSEADIFYLSNANVRITDLDSTDKIFLTADKFPETATFSGSTLKIAGIATITGFTASNAAKLFATNGLYNVKISSTKVASSTTLGDLIDPYQWTTSTATNGTKGIWSRKEAKNDNPVTITGLASSITTETLKNKTYGRFSDSGKVFVVTSAAKLFGATTNGVTIDGSGYTFAFANGSASQTTIGATFETISNGLTYYNSGTYLFNLSKNDTVISGARSANLDAFSVTGLTGAKTNWATVTGSNVKFNSGTYKSGSFISISGGSSYGNGFTFDFTKSAVSVHLATSSATVVGGTGSDHFRIKGLNNVNKVSIVGGGGSDTFNFENATVSGNINLIGGTGSDTFTLSGISIKGGGDFVASGGEKVDTFTISNISMSGGSFKAFGDAGADIFKISNVTISGNNKTFSISGGADDDIFALDKVSGVTLSGGAGADVFSFTNKSKSNVYISDFASNDKIVLSSSIEAGKGSYDSKTKTFTLGVVTIQAGFSGDKTYADLYKNNFYSMTVTMPSIKNRDSNVKLGTLIDSEIWSVNGGSDTAIYKYQNAGHEFFSITGLSKVASSTMSSNVTVGAEQTVSIKSVAGLFDTTTKTSGIIATISGGYKFKLLNSASSTTAGKSFVFDGTTASYMSNGTLTFAAASNDSLIKATDNRDVNFSITGLTAGTKDVSIVGGKVSILSGAYTYNATAPVSIFAGAGYGRGYTFAFASRTNVVLTTNSATVLGSAYADSFKVSGNALKDAKNISIVGGNGDDTINFANATVSGNINLIGGDGSDTFTLSGISIKGGAFVASGGAAADTFTIENISIGSGSFKAFGDDGADIFNIKNVTVASGKTFSVAGGDGSDTFNLTGVKGITLSGGKGEDVFSFTGNANSVYISDFDSKDKIHVSSFEGAKFESGTSTLALGNATITLAGVKNAEEIYGTKVTSGTSAVSVDLGTLIAPYNWVSVDGGMRYQRGSYSSTKVFSITGLASSITTNNIGNHATVDANNHSTVTITSATGLFNLATSNTTSSFATINGGKFVFASSAAASTVTLSTAGLVVGSDYAAFKNSGTFTFEVTGATVIKGNDKRTSQFSITGLSGATTSNVSMHGGNVVSVQGAAYQSSNWVSITGGTNYAGYTFDFSGSAVKLNLATSSATVLGSASADEFKISGAAAKDAKNISIVGGAGSDTFNFENATVSGNINLIGGTGSDTFSLTGISIKSGAFVASGGAVADTFTIENISVGGGSFKAFGDDGADIFNIKNVTISGTDKTFSISGGDGSDTFALDKVSGVTLSGGKGEDIFSFTGKNSVFISDFASNDKLVLSSKPTNYSFSNTKLILGDVTISGFTTGWNYASLNNKGYYNIDVTYSGGHDKLGDIIDPGGWQFKLGADNKVTLGTVTYGRRFAKETNTLMIEGLTNTGWDSAAFKSGVTVTGGQVSIDGKLAAKIFDTNTVATLTSENNYTFAIGEGATVNNAAGFVYGVDSKTAVYKNDGTYTFTTIDGGTKVKASDTRDIAVSISGLNAADSNTVKFESNKFTISGKAYEAENEVTISGGSGYEGYSFDFTNSAVKLNLATSSATVLGGTNKDTFRISGLEDAKKISISGGGGDDAFIVSNSTITGALNLVGKDGTDTFTFAGITLNGGDVKAFGGNGADIFNLSNFTVSGAESKFSVAGGEGSDTFALNKVSGVTLSGGNGEDVFSFTGKNSVFISDFASTDKIVLTTAPSENSSSFSNTKLVLGDVTIGGFTTGWNYASLSSNGYYKVKVAVGDKDSVLSDLLDTNVWSSSNSVGTATYGWEKAGDLFSITGLKESTTSDTLNTNIKIGENIASITSSSVLSKEHGATISGGYSFVLVGKASTTTIDAAWTANAGTAQYLLSDTGEYSASSNIISFTDNRKSDITLTGLATTATKDMFKGEAPSFTVSSEAFASNATIAITAKGYSLTFSTTEKYNATFELKTASTTLIGGAGADTFKVSGMSDASKISISGGSGADTFTVENSSITGAFNLVGGAGSDTFNLTGITVSGAGKFSVAGGNNDSDVFKLSNVSGISISGGAGQDKFEFTNKNTVYISDFDSKDKIVLATSVGSGVFDSEKKTLTLGSNTLTLNGVTKDSEIYKVDVENGSGKHVELGSLIAPYNWATTTATSATWQRGEYSSTAVFTITGLASAVKISDLTNGISVHGGIVDINSATVLSPTNGATISGSGYTFNLAQGLYNTIEAQWGFGTSSETATYYDAGSEVYKHGAGSTTIIAEADHAVLVSMTGLTAASADNVTMEENNVVSVKGSAYGKEKDVSILQGAGYTYNFSQSAVKLTLSTSSATVIGSADADTFTVSGMSDAKKISISGGNGADTFNVDKSTITGAFNLVGGAGSDTFNLKGITINSSTGVFSVAGGEGADTFSLTSISVSTTGKFSVVGGEGADTFIVEGSKGITLVTDGSDTLRFKGNVEATLTNFNTSDTIILDDSVVSGTFKDSVLTLGNVKLTLSNVTKDSGLSTFYSTVIDNNGTNVKLGDLVDGEIWRYNSTTGVATFGRLYGDDASEVKITGLGTNNGKITAERFNNAIVGKTVVLDKALLSNTAVFSDTTKKIVFDGTVGSYSVKLASDADPTYNKEFWSTAGKGQVIYASPETISGYKLDADTITYVSQADSQHVTISGLVDNVALNKSKTITGIALDNGTFTISGNVLSTAKVSLATVTGGTDYKMTLADGLAPQTIDNYWRRGSDSSVSYYTSVGSSTGYSVASAGHEIQYVKAIDQDASIKIQGLKEKLTTKATDITGRTVADGSYKAITGLTLTNGSELTIGTSVVQNKVVTVTGGDKTYRLGGSLNLITGSSNVVLVGSTKADTLNASTAKGSVTIEGGAGNDVLKGGEGADTLGGGTGNDTLTGGKGKDTFVYSGGKDVITDFSNDDGDVINNASGRSVTKSSYDATNKILTLTIGSGSLKFNNAENLDVSIGGAVYNQNYIYNDTSHTKVTLATGITATDSDFSKDDNKVEAIDASKLSKATVKGGSKTTSILGSKGADSLDVSAATGKVTIDGGAGNDTIIAGKESSLIGGAGNDVFVYSSSSNMVIKDYGTGTDKISLGSAKVTDASVSGNNIILTIDGGSTSTVAGSITLEGANGKQIRTVDEKGSLETWIYGDHAAMNTKKTSAKFYAEATGEIQATSYATGLVTIDASEVTSAVYILGNAKNNVIVGSDKGDTIAGGAGNDKVTLGSGNDTYVYSGGKDVIASYAADKDQISITGGVESITNAAIKDKNLVITIGKGTLTLESIIGADADTAIVTVNGTEYTFGNNYLATATNAKLFAGYKGDYVATNGQTLLSASLATAAVQIDGRANTGASITAAGGKKNDTLWGGSRADSLVGNAGADILIGGKGNDTLTGGAGKDIFVYNTGDDNDVITDYAAGDKININRAKSVKAYIENKTTVVIDVDDQKKAITLNGTSTSTKISIITPDGKTTTKQIKATSADDTAAILFNETNVVTANDELAGIMKESSANVASLQNINSADELTRNAQNTLVGGSK